MRTILYPFWDFQARRLRALWRLILQIVIWLITIAGLTVCLGAALAGTILVNGGIGAGSSGTELTEQISAMFSNDPAVSVILNTASVLAMLGSVWLAGRFLDRRRFADFGFHFRPGWWADLGFGLALGVLLMTFIFGIEQAAGWITITGTFDAGSANLPFVVAFLLQVVLYIGVGISEETFSRGYQLKNMAEGLRLGRLSPRTGAILSLLVTSAIFGALHMSNPSASPISTFNIVLAGLMLGLPVLLTGDLAISIGLHITWNLFQGNVFGFPVSGTGAGAPSVIAITQSGPELMTGGAFGPEAGLAGILAMLVGTALMVAWIRFRYGAITIQDRLAEPPERPVPIAVVANE